MKKFLAVALVLCMTFVFVGCKLPDPEEALQRELDSISNADEAYMERLRDGMDDVELLVEFPELKDAYLDTQKAIALQMEYEIIESTVDKKAKTATVTLQVTRIAEDTAFDILEPLLIDYTFLYLLFGKEEDAVAINKYGFEKLAEIYSDPTVERTTTTVSVEMIYDSEIKDWVIADRSVLNG